MAETKPERAKIVKETLARFPDTATLTLAKKLYKKYPQWWSTLESCRKSVRYYRGNSGKKDRHSSRNHAELHRPRGDQTKPNLPPSQAEGWEPYVLASKRCLILSDAHVPYHSEEALSVAVEYGKQQDVDTVLINGDWADFYTISRWEKNPQKRRLKNEMDAVRQSLDWLKHELPEATLVFKEGNHEYRWTAYIWQKAAELWDLPQCRLPEILQLEDLGIEYVAEQRPVLFGGDTPDHGLPIFHGHELPRGLTNPVNMARGAFLRTVHTMLCGHGHRTSQHTEPNMFHKEITCWSTGCLCDLRPEYARVNKWNWGFAVARTTPDGWWVDNKRISKDGEVR